MGERGVRRRGISAKRGCWCKKNKEVTAMMTMSNQRITRGGLFVRGRFVWFCGDGVERSGKEMGEISKRKTKGGVVVSMVMSA
jgi:hypothetical protein